MTNVEFQKLMIEKLNNMDAKISSIEGNLDARISSLENSIDTKIAPIVKKLDAVYEQTANLVEFRTEVNAQLEIISKRLDVTTEKIDTIIEDNKSIHELLGEHEVSIRTLRRKPV